MKAFYRLLARWPLGLLYFLADASFFVLYYLAAYRKHIVRDNLRHAFPEKSSSEITALSKGFYRYLCDNMVEILKSMSLNETELRKRVVFNNADILQPYIEQQQSILILAIHQSNWEWLLHALSVHLPFPVDVVYKPLHNQPLDQLMKQSRQRYGADLIPFKTAGKEILRKRRQFRGFVMAADQSPSGGDKKYWHHYMNRCAPFYLGPQKIAEMMNYPVFYLKMHRVKRGYYQAEFELLGEPPYQKDSYAVLDHYINAAERSIRQQPETFLWTNQKWKRKPETSSNNVNIPESDADPS